MSKKIVFIVPFYPPNIRVTKFIRSFIEREFKVYVLSYNLRKFNLYNSIVNFEDGNIINYLINSIFNYPNIPFDFLRDRKIRSYVEKINPDYIICRDVFLSTFLNLRFKIKNNNTKFILDLCDNYPEVVESTYKGFVGRFLGAFLNFIEKRSLKLFDHVIFVSEHSFKYVSHKHLIKNLKYSIVYNVPLKPKFGLFSDISDKDRYGMVYIGTIDKDIRDLDTIFKAIKYLKDKGGSLENFDIYYFESDKSFVETYRKLCINYGIGEIVNFYKAVKRSELDAILKKYKIGLVPHRRNKAVDFTIPNKIFDYISNGLAVLASNNPAMMDIINKYDIGIVYEGGNYIDCAFKMNKLMIEYYTKEYFIKGPIIIQKELNWEYFFENFYNSILKR